jgi:hypothetical protein
MSTKASIMAAIETKVKSITTGYGAWRIGLTHDLSERKKYWGETKGESTGCWTNWTADSLSDAQEIERCFIHDKGMMGGVGGDLSAYKTVYVYIF